MENSDKQPGISTQVYLDLCENAPIGIFRTTAQGKIISANTAVARMLKFHSPEDLIAEVNRTSVAEALYAEPAKWQEITKNVLACDGWRAFEERFRCRDDTMITCALQLRATAGNDARAEIHGFIEDISERRQAEKSLRLSQFIIDNASIGIFRGDHHGNIVYVNEHGARALGYTRKELCSMSFFDIDPDLTPEWWAAHRKKLAAAGSNTFESIHRRKDGTVLPVEVTVSYLKFGEQLISCSFAQDISSLKQAEEQLKLAAFSMDNISDAVFWITQNTRFWNVNRAACEMLGFSRDEMLSMSIADIDPFFVLKDWQNHIMQIRQTGSVHLPNRFHRTKDGRIIPVEITTNYLLFNGVEYYCAIIRDISDRKKVQEERLRTQKLESLGVLAGGIAHDFNNLLTRIMGNLSLVRMLLPAESKAQERLQSCEKAVREATGLTGQLLTFSRGGEPAKKLIDLRQVVRDAATFVLRGSNVAGKLQIDEGLWPIEADEGQIGQVLNNLLINADQAMPGGGVVRVALDNCTLAKNEIAALQPGFYVLISVADQGCGISPEDLSRIFDPYFTTKTTGTGLGLTSIYSIVKRHGGEVIASSKMGEGATFKVYLPASPESRVEDEAAETPSPYSGRGYVIVMDDEENIREVAGEMLSFFGYRFSLCSCGEEVVAIYKGKLERGIRPSAVIMDLTVPGKMGGLEATSKILSLDPSARIIVSSGYSRDAVMSDYKKYGFSDALHKPFSMEEMSAVLKKIVGEKSDG